MTIFDLLFLACALCAIVTLIVAAVTRSLETLTKLGVSALSYVVMVYSATVFSKPRITHIGQPQCNDDWCLAVDNVSRNGSSIDVKLRILSEAKRVTMREAGAKDVYLVDDQWRRYDPIPRPSDVALSVRLGPGESVPTTRHFVVPAGVHITGMKIDSGRTPATLCLVIGECEAFHRGKMIALG